MLNELIEKIEICNAEVIDGIKMQNIIIHYNCIGVIEIPDEDDLIKPNIVLQTRQGVELKYGKSVAV